MNNKKITVKYKLEIPKSIKSFKFKELCNCINVAKCKHTAIKANDIIYIKCHKIVRINKMIRKKYSEYLYSIIIKSEFPVSNIVLNSSLKNFNGDNIFESRFDLEYYLQEQFIPYLDQTTGKKWSISY